MLLSPLLVKDTAIAYVTRQNEARGDTCLIMNELDELVAIAYCDKNKIALFLQKIAMRRLYRHCAMRTLRLNKPLMKATIVLYSDMFELDRTEISYSTQKQLRAIVESLASDNAETQLVEVYSHPSMTLSYRYSRPRRGAHLKEQKKAGDHPNWGGYRPGSGAKPKPVDDVLSVRVEIAVRKDMAAVLDNIKGESRASFIRKAIADRLRQVQQVTVDPLPKPYPKPAPKDDQRYHRALRSLPATLRRYEGNERTCIPLHIDRTEDGWHAYYGPPDQQGPDAPSFQAPRLIAALEDLVRWLAMHRNKFVIGTTESTTNRAETVREACEKPT